LRNLERAHREQYLPVEESASFTHSTITADRFTSRRFLDEEWESLWPRVWLMGGRTSELEKAGDYICKDIGRDSVLLVRGRDDTIRAFLMSASIAVASCNLTAMARCAP